MASHRSNSLYAIKECMTCGSLYTRECCSIGSLEDKILTPVPDSSPCCAKCGTPVDGPYCHGCAFLRKKFEEDLLTYCGENETSKDFEDISESSDDNTNVDCSPQFPFVYEQEPCYNQNFSDNYYPQDSPSFSQQYLCCAYCGGPHYDYQCQPINETYYEPNPSYDYSGFDHPQPPQDSVDCQEALDKILEELKEIKRDRRKKIKDMSIEEMRHEQQLVDYKIKEITNDLGIKRFRGEEIDEEYERDCEIRIRKLKQDFNEWGSEVRKKEQAYEEEQYAAARRRMLSIPFVDEDDYIPLGDIIARYSTSKVITPDLPIEEPDNSLNMGDEHLNTIPATESDKVIKSSVENLVPIPREFEDRPYFRGIADELAHMAPIPPGIIEANFDPNDDTSSDDDSFENIEYVDASPSYSKLDSLEEENEDQEEKEFNLEDIFQIQDVILCEKLLNIHRLISKIKSLKYNPTPDHVLESPSPFPIPVADSDSFLKESDTSLSHLDNSLPEFEIFSDHTEETRSGSTTTHANYFFPEYDSFLFEIEPDQEGLISIDNPNEPLLEFPEFESFHFDPSFPRPPLEPPDVCMRFKPILAMKNDFVKPNEDLYLSETMLSLNVEDVNSFTFIIWTFLLYFTYTEESPLIFSFKSENFVFDPDIITFHNPVAVSMKVSCSKINQQFLKPLVSGVVSRFTRASHPLFEISLGRSDILSSYRFTFIFA
ncbi:hypothetical protein Tco_0654660 [Tanacetum coccineum]|uniref:Uncharacterized protein n=1 Tax=Tanacetum coccineum TaxID=301880 RepID=A0ABQ4X3U1_9ASTR